MRWEKYQSNLCRTHDFYSAKYTSLFIKYLQAAFFKVIQPLQRDSMPWQSEVIKKEAMAKFNI